MLGCLPGVGGFLRERDLSASFIGPIGSGRGGLGYEWNERGGRC